jgi:putative hydrolase of the HAD superfamily
VLGDDDLTFTIAQIEKAYWASQGRFEEIRARGLDMGFKEQMDVFLDMIREGLAGSLSPRVKKRLATRHANTFLEHPPDLMPGALEVLETLKARGCKIGLICNSGATPGKIQRRFLRDIGLSRRLQTLTFSDEEGLAKPSPGIFLSTLRTLKVSPEASAHIGDRPETDILGAKGVGMRAILIGQASCDGLPVAPDARIQRLAELPAVLERIGKSGLEPGEHAEGGSD